MKKIIITIININIKSFA